MGIKKEEISVVRINQSNYSDFTKLIEWRRTGKEQEDLSYYENNEMKAFFDHYHILDSDGFFIFAAKIGDEFVGYINVSLIPKPDPRLGILYVDELWTPEVYRNKGIASILMDEVFKVAKELKLWRVRLFVGSDNDVARNYYKKVGYSETDDCKCCELDVKDIKL